MKKKTLNQQIFKIYKEREKIEKARLENDIKLDKILKVLIPKLKKGQKCLACEKAKRIKEYLIQKIKKCSED